MPPTQPPQWMADLSERDNQAIAHARAYAQGFSGAGVPGHGQFLLLATLAQKLDAAEQTIKRLEQAQ